MDKTKRIRTAAAELMFARVTNVMQDQLAPYLEGKTTISITMRWPEGDELKVFERVINEVRHETMLELRRKCFDLFADQHVKTTEHDVYDRLYREVFSEIAVPALTSEKKRVNDDEKVEGGQQAQGRTHQVSDREVEHPAEVVPAPAHRGKRRRAADRVPK